MDINALMAELAQYIRIQEEAAATVEALKDQIKAKMTASGVDTSALKKDLPDIAAQYTKTTETRRFTFA